MKKSMDFKSVIIGIFIPITIFLFMGYGSSEYMNVKRLTIVDDDNNPVINLGINTNGGGFIELGNRNGKQALIISTTSSGDGALEIYGYNGFVSAAYHR